MPPAPANLLSPLPRLLPEEEFSEILSRPDLRIERIVSTGQASPPGYWYDQPWDEWVLVLAGAARLRIEGEAADRDLAPGDHLLLPARTRHRVEWTAPDAPTVWLAVHCPPTRAG
ncbi:cupin domain-containing protein [Methylobacterium oryzihabitans]|uniref:Cupin domain-containing protein n=1 Tax=Methylobacterium oryzihabitans TaxID=2499852 RepID=A0A3S3U2G5_9HYPH|nr:cupin domain-containing protein [Methylobacterium oryzihabitans]RVU14014.1 cupin domain-containing protein [Methylobacterium oryzihabitans]